jgi:hypothetical protein
VTGLRRALVGLGIAGFIAGAVPLVLALSTPETIDSELIAVFGPLIGWSFIGTGLYAWDRRPDNRFGPLMTAVGFTWCVSGLSVSRTPGVFIVGYAVGSLPFALLFHMLCAFPSGRLQDRFSRIGVGLGYFVTTVLWWVILLFYDSTRDTWATNPINAFDDDRVADFLIGAQSALGLVALMMIPLILRRRWERASGAQRQVLVPVYVAASILVALLTLTLVADLVGVSGTAEKAADIAGLVALAAIPFAFLFGLMRSRLSRAGAIAELVARLAADDRRRGMRDALADALGDPGLTLLYWVPARERYVNAEGRPTELPEPGDARVATVVEDHGKPVAAIVPDA